MSFSHDRRGQSVVVGTVILFGFLILALSLYQVQFVPAENEEIEFEHSQQVEGEFLDLRNAVLQAGSTGSAQSTRIQLGERYPQRTFFLNPPPAAGTLQTTDTNAIEVNGQIGDGAHENVQAFWETDPQFNSTSIRYTSNYNEYRGAPQLVYEHSVVAAEFDDAVLFRSDQTVVRNDRISVTALSGDISETGVQAQSVDLRPISRSVRTVPITGDGGDVEIVLPTAVDNTTALRDRWATTLPGATVTEDSDAIRIVLDGSETYRLGLSAVSVDDTGETEPAYIVPITGNGTVGQSVGVEVRDKYNNPVTGTEVSLGGTVENTTDDGRAFFEPDASGEYSATINGGGESYESVQFNVAEASDTGTNRTFDVEWQDTGPKQLTEGTNGTLTVNIADRATSTSINDAQIDYSYAKVGNPAGEIAIPPNTTNHDGVDTIDLRSNTAQAGDEFDVYASAGDDVDVIRVEITSAGSTMASQVSTVDDTASTSGNSGRVLFNVSSNTNVNLDAAAIETTGNLSSAGANQNSKFIVAGTSSNTSSSVDGSFDYQFNSLTIEDGETEVEFNQLDTGIENVGTVGSASDADLIVSLRFDDGSIKQLFFKADER